LVCSSFIMIIWIDSYPIFIFVIIKVTLSLGIEEKKIFLIFHHRKNNTQLHKSKTQEVWTLSPYIFFFGLSICSFTPRKCHLQHFLFLRNKSGLIFIFSHFIFFIFFTFLESWWFHVIVKIICTNERFFENLLVNSTLYLYSLQSVMISELN